MLDHENKFRDFLKHKGLKLTKSRNLVLEAAFKLHEHFDAETLYSHIRSAQVSLATVYRTLPLLLEAGLIQMAVRSDGRDRFEHILGHPKHVHWICDRCKRVLETDLSALESGFEGAARGISFQIREISLNITGICSQCRSNDYE